MPTADKHRPALEIRDWYCSDGDRQPGITVSISKDCIRSILVALKRMDPVALFRYGVTEPGPSRQILSSRDLCERWQTGLRAVRFEFRAKFCSGRSTRAS